MSDAIERLERRLNVLGAKVKQKTKYTACFLILGYLIAALIGTLLAICSGGIISFILAIYLVGKIFDKQHFD